MRRANAGSGSRGRDRAWRAGLLLLALALFGCQGREEARLAAAREVFDRHCARCHGGSQGEGPQFVESFGAVAPDLRELSQLYGMPLPRAPLAEYIDGRRDVEAHGPRDMPVWGEELYGDLPAGADVEDMRAEAIAMLIDYLESIQRLEGEPKGSHLEGEDRS